MSTANDSKLRLVYAVGFSAWKRKALALCLAEYRVRFVPNAGKAPDGGLVAVWGAREVPFAKQREFRVLRIEDGFLRSVGLGADLIRPVSWIVDTRGIYFDATQPSDLEVLLQTVSFDAALLARARELRARIVALGLTKYNVGTAIWRRPRHAARVILVPGQVESDASIALGAPGIKTNLGLLQAVRKANPDAHIVYKPHPDVIAGLRRKGEGEEDAERWSDEIVVDAPMGQMLNEVDEVHCLTSLAGFEALLRGKAVTCYGQPFYAGWGLTTDIVPIARRRRCLSLDELVAGALIRYPRYMSRKKDALISPEEALEELIEWRAASTGSATWLRKAFRVVLRRVVGVR